MEAETRKQILETVDRLAPRACCAPRSGDRRDGHLPPHLYKAAPNWASLPLDTEKYGGSGPDLIAPLLISERLAG